ncbi:MAG: hypothetical protein K2K07_08195 [Lachnospiraceae bacterium]|nr:hypothetical protein [Lachnospiraceae bacterium]
MSSKHILSSSTSCQAESKPEKFISKKRRKPRVNWHEAVSCAIQIELKDFSDYLKYETEYALGKNNYRIDLLVIKKLTDFKIPKKIASIFRTFNLFEIKGIGSSASIDAYHKTIGYAGLLISQSGKKNEYSSLDVSLTILSLHYPRKLMTYLKSKREIAIEKYCPGVYHINKETFTAQIIVTQELSPEENLYLHCLTNQLQDRELINRLRDDYTPHRDEDIYARYMHQLTTANIKVKGDAPMIICEGLLNLYGTSSEEIIERTRQEDADYYLPKINVLSTQNDYLKSLLKQHNIPFDLDFKTNIEQ